ncbi:MAG TPA: M48 family metalloprotease, partial [Solirubrobacter sp.]|nr:M48 family metalloprotease [Solirubrobacter sp.]
MRARRDLFGADPGLLARMVVVALATPLVALAGLAAVIVLASWEIVGVVFLALIVGAVVALRERVAMSSRGSRLSPADAPELHAVVERLCVLADLAKPAIVLERLALPNSWVEGTKRGGFRLHLTQGLLDLLEPRELEAVIAH